MENLYRPAIARSYGRRLKEYVMLAAADPSVLKSDYVLPPDYEIMTETAEVFTKALLLGMEPETDKGNFADDVDILPFEEAVAYMRRRLPVDGKTYYALADKMRYRAFTVSRLADGDAVRNVQSMLVKAMDEGSGIQQFLQLTEGQLADAAGMGKGAGWYYETVYRTNTATAYNVGRAIAFEETPPVALELIGIDDARQTEFCHSLTVPPLRKPYGDPVWEHLWPPFHFNCRTTIRAIYDESEIEDAGGPDKFYTQGAPDYTPDKGFGTYPLEKSDTWWDITDAMEARAEEYGLEIEFMEAREKLIGTENTQPDDPLEEAARKEAENYARDNLGLDHADYTGIDSRLANEWNTHLSNTLHEFPELKDTLRFTGSTEEQNRLLEPVINTIHRDTVRMEHPGISEVDFEQRVATLNQQVIKMLNLENKIARNISPRDKRLRPFSGIAINPEFGNSMVVFEKQLENDVAAGFLPIGTASVKAAHDHEVAHQLDHLLGLRNDPEMNALWNRYTKNEKTAGLSEHGARKIEDFIADGWAEYRNNPRRRHLSIEIGSLILRKYSLWKR